MANIGGFALLCILVISCFGFIAALLGRRPETRRFEKVAEHAVYACFALYLMATASLIYLLGTSQFAYAYVANETNRELPFFFKLTAVWAGQEGSLLFWGFLLSTYAAAIVAGYRKKFPELMPYISMVFLITIFFFSILHIFVSHPFNELALVQPDGSLTAFVPEDGQGLNPLLQHWAMIIHPPLLYLGYVGCIVPFAFAIAALATRRTSVDWIRATRRWTLIAWFFLGAGILLGAKWAYAVLGWGGYWSWDPVENASLMPWLTMTVFLHSVMPQERRGMLKVWNMSLVTLSFALSIFGTFLTRSGIVSSVHAFGASSIGTYFAVFLCIIIAVSGFLILTRLSHLKSENRLDSIFSRESAFFFNNLILLGACLAVLWGTMYPVISEALEGQKITVGATFFNRINVPIGIFLLLVIGVCPFFTWKRTSLDSLRRNLLLPILCGILSAILLVMSGMRVPAAIATISCGVIVIVTIAIEFYRGARMRHMNSSDAYPVALFRLIMKNKRRYGGYFVHISIVMLFVGFAGAIYNSEFKAELKQGEAAQFGKYLIQCAGVTEGENPNYFTYKAYLHIIRGETDLGVLSPERRFYKASQQPSSEVAIHTSLIEDLYLVFAGMSDDGQRAVIQIYANPLVTWIWLGGLVFVLGSLIAILPDRMGTGDTRGA